MYHYAEVLEEVLQFAKKEQEAGNEGAVYILEKEVAPAGEFLIGDEDTGNKFEEEIKLVLETTENSVYYTEVFEEMLFYKQALEQLEQLKDYYPIKWVNESVLDQKNKELQNT